jgi:hypothetical protein
MKIYCKGYYSNPPAGLFFTQAGVVEVDEAKAEFLLRDAPDNFSRDLPAPKENVKAPETPARDKAVKAPTNKK